MQRPQDRLQLLLVLFVGSIAWNLLSWVFRLIGHGTIANLLLLPDVALLAVGGWLFLLFYLELKRQNPPR